MTRKKTQKGPSLSGDRKRFSVRPNGKAPSLVSTSTRALNEDLKWQLGFDEFARQSFDFNTYARSSFGQFAGNIRVNELLMSGEQFALIGNRPSHSPFQYLHQLISKEQGLTVGGNLDNRLLGEMSVTEKHLYKTSQHNFRRFERYGSSWTLGSSFTNKTEDLHFQQTMGKFSHSLKRNRELTKGLTSPVMSIDKATFSFGRAIESSIQTRSNFTGRKKHMDFAFNKTREFLSGKKAINKAFDAFMPWTNGKSWGKYMRVLTPFSSPHDFNKLLGQQGIAVLDIETNVGTASQLNKTVQANLSLDTWRANSPALQNLDPHTYLSQVMEPQLGFNTNLYDEYGNVQATQVAIIGENGLHPGFSTPHKGPIKHGLTGERTFFQEQGDFARKTGTAAQSSHGYWARKPGFNNSNIPNFLQTPAEALDSFVHQAMTQKELTGWHFNFDFHQLMGSLIANGRTDDFLKIKTRIFKGHLKISTVEDDFFRIMQKIGKVDPGFAKAHLTHSIHSPFGKPGSLIDVNRPFEEILPSLKKSEMGHSLEGIVNFLGLHDEILETIEAQDIMAKGSKLSGLQREIVLDEIKSSHVGAYDAVATALIKLRLMKIEAALETLPVEEHLNYFASQFGGHVNGAEWSKNWYETVRKAPKNFGPSVAANAPVGGSRKVLKNAVQDAADSRAGQKTLRDMWNKMKVPGYVKVAGGILAALAVSNVFSSGDKYSFNSIEGLDHTYDSGIDTDFGSGYQGLEKSPALLQTYRNLGITLKEDSQFREFSSLGVAAGAAAGGVWAMNKFGLPKNISATIRAIEKSSPMGMLGAFRISEFASLFDKSADGSFLPGNVFLEGNRYSGTAKYFDRTMPGFDKARAAKEGIRYESQKGTSKYRVLYGTSGDLIGEAYVMRGGHIMDSASRYKAPLRDIRRPRRRLSSDWYEQMVEGMQEGTRPTHHFNNALQDFFVEYLHPKIKANNAFGKTARGAIKGFREFFWHRGAQDQFRSAYKANIFAEGVEAHAEELFFPFTRADDLFGGVKKLLFHGLESPLQSDWMFNKGSYNSIRTLGKQAGTVIGALYLGWKALELIDFGGRESGFTGPITTAQNLAANTLIAQARMTDAIPGARGLEEFYHERLNIPGSAPLGAGLTVAALAGMYSWTARVKAEMLAKNFRPTAKVGKIGAVQEMERLLSSAVEYPDGALAKKIGSLASSRKLAKVAGVVGLAAAALFLPASLLASKTEAELRAEFSGEKLVPMKKGRFWELGSTPYAGEDESHYKHSWYYEARNKPRLKALYGSEANFYLNRVKQMIPFAGDPYSLEKKFYHDRPYPYTAPMFAEVPLVGPVLSRTLGRFFKPPLKMHINKWGSKVPLREQQYLEEDQFGETPMSPHSLRAMIRDQSARLTEWSGLKGWALKSLYGAVTGSEHPFSEVPEYESAGMMSHYGRQYHERGLGGLLLQNEIYRRFYPRPERVRRINDIKNEMPSWLPEDYFAKYQSGDVMARMPYGELRLPGSGYEMLHPEVKGVHPEDYSEFHKAMILSDVAPYHYMTEHRLASAIEKYADQPELAAQLMEADERRTRIVEHKDSFEQRIFSERAERIEGTVSKVTHQGVELQGREGQFFRFSGISTDIGSLSMEILTRNNQLTVNQARGKALGKQQEIVQVLNEELLDKHVSLTIPKGGAEGRIDVPAVIKRGGTNINQLLINKGYAQSTRGGGAELQGMYGPIGRAVGRGYEALTHVTEYPVPTPFMSKFLNTRSAVDQYKYEEIYGAPTRMWTNPYKDFIRGYGHNLRRKITGAEYVPEHVQQRRDTELYFEMLKERRNEYSETRQRNALTSDIFNATPERLQFILPKRERKYFMQFLGETDPRKRRKILSLISPHMSIMLQAQWDRQRMEVLLAEKRSEVRESDIKKSYRQMQRKIASFYQFGKYDVETATQLRVLNEKRELYRQAMRIEALNAADRLGYNVPGRNWIGYNKDTNLTDVKLRLVTEEGYDMHEFNIWEDQSRALHSKPHMYGTEKDILYEQEKSTLQGFFSEFDAFSQVTSSPHFAGGDVTFDVDDRAIFQKRYREDKEKFLSDFIGL